MKSKFVRRPTREVTEHRSKTCVAHRPKVCVPCFCPNLVRFRPALEPVRHAHSGAKENQANNQEQEKQKFRNSRRSRGNYGKAKERSYQRNHQKKNSPPQHNDPSTLF